LNSRRKLLEVVDPREMVQVMRSSVECVQKHIADVGPEPSESAQSFLGRLRRLEEIKDFSSSETIRLIQTEYFTRFMPLVQRMRESRRQKTEPPPGVILD